VQLSQRPAIIVRSNNAYPADLWVIRISDGKTVSHTTYALEMGLLADVVGSVDATLIPKTQESP